MATDVVSTIRASGGDYTSLSAWEAGEQGDLVTADERRIAECYNDWPSGLSNAVVIDGSTTDATRYLVIRAAAGQAHTGVPGSGFWMYSNSASISAIDVRDPYTLIERIEAAVTNTGSGFARGIYFNSGSSDSVAHGCIARSLAASGSGIQIVSAAARASVRACLAHDSLKGIVASATTHTIDNCTAADCGTGFDTSAAALVRNSVAYNNTTNWSGTWSGSSTHNATSSGSDDAPGGNSVTGISSSDFVDAANNDFHLASGSALIGVGTNLYSNFTLDIDGDTWPSSGAWDIGCDYRVAGGSHDATGAMSAQSATVSGSAAAVATYTSSGAPTAQAATVAGTANHVTTHASSGVLEAQAATVAGSADHSAAGAFSATGALTAQVATVAGSAAHLTLHTATGALVADSATAAGSAVHYTLHTAAGDLVADAASISGSALHEGDGAEVAKPFTGAGRPRRTRQRVVVEIDGEDFITESPEEAQAILDQAKEAAEEKAKVAIERATKARNRPTRKVMADARKALELPAISAPDLGGYAEEISRQIEDIYQSAIQTIEVAALLRKRELEEEDDEDILMLL